LFGGTSAKRKLPSASLVAVRLYPVIEFEIDIVAFGTTAPFGSTIVPLIVPAVSACAREVAVAKKRMNANNANPTMNLGAMLRSPRFDLVGRSSCDHFEVAQTERPWPFWRMRSAKSGAQERRMWLRELSEERVRVGCRKNPRERTPLCAR